MCRGEDDRLVGGESKCGDLGPIEDLLLVSRDDCGVRYMVGVRG